MLSGKLTYTASQLGQLRSAGLPSPPSALAPLLPAEVADVAPQEVYGRSDRLVRLAFCRTPAAGRSDHTASALRQAYLDIQVDINNLRDEELRLRADQVAYSAAVERAGHVLRQRMAEAVACVDPQSPAALQLHRGLIAAICNGLEQNERKRRELVATWREWRQLERAPRTGPLSRSEALALSAARARAAAE